MGTGKVVMALLYVLLFACNNNGGASNEKSIMDSLAMKIYIDKEGIIIVNGHQVDLRTLALKLDSLERKNGVVYYSRANIAAEPPANAIMVMQMVTHHGLPVKFFADKNFKKPVKVE